MNKPENATLATQTLASAPHGLLTRAGIAAFAAKILRALRHRREILDLSALDERMLKDIGISRSDVQTALDEAWHRDPSQILSTRADEHVAETWRHVMARHKPRSSACPLPSTKVVTVDRRAA